MVNGFFNLSWLHYVHLLKVKLMFCQLISLNWGTNIIKFSSFLIVEDNRLYFIPKLWLQVLVKNYTIFY
jgi:hypothetical protein